MLGLHSLRLADLPALAAQPASGGKSAPRPSMAGTLKIPLAAMLKMLLQRVRRPMRGRRVYVPGVAEHALYTA